MVQRALGRRPHDPARPVLKLGKYLTNAQPEHPAQADYLSKVSGWDCYQNDQFNVGGPAAIANQRRQITRYARGIEDAPSLVDVLELYKILNPDFNPLTGEGDDGVNLADLLSAVVKHGIGGTRAVGYLSVDVKNPEEVRAAIAMTGSLIWGVDLDVAQRDQADNRQPWDYVREGEHWGRQVVLAGAYTSDIRPGAVDCEVIAWGERHGTTDEFAARQLAEAWMVIWPEMLGSPGFEHHLDMPRLAADYQAFTGRAFGAPPEPPTISQFREQLITFIEQAEHWLEATK
jgi:hypothetical protein